MSLEKAVQYGKEKRKPYYNAGRFDYSCRPNGGCPHCEANRKHSFKKASMKASKIEQENEYHGYYNIPDPEDAMMSFEEELYKKLGKHRFKAEQDYEESEDWTLD